MYVLDEPSIGLHQRDNQKLLHTLKEMRDLGNTVLVVEHDLETILAADHVVDLGPGAGEHGGWVVAQGTPAEICRQRGLHHRPLPLGQGEHPRAPQAPQGHPGADPGAGRHGEQPAQGGRGLPHRPLHLRHRRLGLGQEHPGERDPLQGPGQPAPPGRARRGQAQGHQGPGARGQGHRHRPGPHRPHPPEQPRHLHGALHATARAVFPAARKQGQGLFPGPVQLQRQGRPLREVRRRRRPEDRDALPPRHLRHLRAVQGQALQPGDPGDPLQGQERLRRAGHDRGGGPGALLAHPGAGQQAPDPVRRGPGLHPAGAERHDAIGRRGPAGQAGARNCPSGRRAAPSTSWTSPPPACT